MTRLPMCTRSQPQTNDCGVLGSTDRHDSVKGRRSSPAEQECQRVWGPLWGVAPVPREVVFERLDELINCWSVIFDWAMIN